MSNPRVTITMLVYNAEEYLRHSIDSVLNQSLGDFELLVIDDGSTDASPDIVHSYKDPRIRVIRNPTNRGVSWSRPRAVELARGEYIAVLDSDDLSVPKRLQVQVDYLDRHPEIDAVGSAFEVIDKNGRIISVIHVPTDPLAIRWKLLYGDCICHSTVMFRKNRALNLSNYDERVLTGEDFDLWIRFAAQGKIAQLDSVLTQWRQHDKSLQSVEPIETKDHIIWTVVRSVRMQAGLEIDFDVARSLFRERLIPAVDQKSLLRAYSTIAECLARFLLLPDLSGVDKKHLRTYALEDIFWLARRNPGSFHHALNTAARCLEGHHFAGVISEKTARWALMALFPNSITRLVDRIFGTNTLYN